MAETKNIGLRALINASGLEGRELTAGRIGFILAPRLNAVGRIGDAKRGLDLLLSSDESEANAIARDLEEINRTRQAIDRETLESARKLASTRDLDSVAGLVLAAEGWHAGRHRDRGVAARRGPVPSGRADRGRWRHREGVGTIDPGV